MSVDFSILQIMVNLIAISEFVLLTSNSLASSNKSNDFFHYLGIGHEILLDDFQIIQSTNASDLKTAESISNLWMDIIHS